MEGVRQMDYEGPGTDSDSAKRAPSVVLTRVAPFSVGGLAVEPALLQLRSEDDRTEQVEPLVMQVLVALWRSRGEPLSRDDLIAQCWSQRIVADNAVDRVVSHLRAALRRLAPDRLEVVTINRVGYRLHDRTGEIAPTSGPGLIGRLRRMRESGRSGRIALAVLLPVVLFGAAALRWQGGGDSFDSLIEVQPFAGGGDAEARILASDVRDEFMDVLNRTQIATREGGGWNWFGLVRPARRVLTARISKQDRHVQIAVRLVDAPSGTALWTERFTGTVDDTNGLALQAAAATVRTVYTARDLDFQPSLDLTPKLVGLYLESHNALRNPQLSREGVPRQISERMIAEAPNFAAAHAVRALALVKGAGLADAPARQNLLALSRAEAKKAVGLSPAASGTAFDALYQAARLERPDGFLEAENELLAGMRQAPTFAFIVMRECRLLLEVGRSREALRYCQRALALHPFAEPIEWTYAQALASAGEEGWAKLAIEQSARHSPEHFMTTRMRLDLQLFGDDPQRARLLLHDASAAGLQLSGEAVAALDQVLSRNRGMSEGQRADLAKRLGAASREGKLPLDFAVLALASLNRQDEAFALLADMPRDQILAGLGTAFLFRAPAASLRADPRFWPLAVRLGLVRYWLQRKRWPDFCNREVPLARCQSEASKALGQERPA
jgi:DNA-binding winged helix-turn-helix (wHTH) protein/tetratricopeptide (TPR) repeat protein